MSNLWLPGVPAGPIEEFVGALLRHIERFATEKGVEKPNVEVELVDGARYLLESLTAEPGFGFITITQHKRDGDDPDEIVLPVGSIRRIELSHTAEQEPAIGFSLPHPG